MLFAWTCTRCTSGTVEARRVQDNLQLLQAIRDGCAPGSTLLAIDLATGRLAGSNNRYAELSQSFIFGQDEADVRPFFAKAGWNVTQLLNHLDYAPQYELKGRREYPGCVAPQHTKPGAAPEYMRHMELDSRGRGSWYLVCKQCES